MHVVIDAYADESDLQDAPIPANAVLEGDNQNGPVAGLANRGDSHLIVYDEDNNVAYEFYNASRPGENSDGQWHADQESVWDMKTDTFRTLGWTSADAAGLPILPGLVRPDEALPTSQGGQGVINHAIRFTLQNNIILNQFLYPASHIANSGTNAAIQPPMGARFRLKAGVDISTLNPQSRVIAQAMKDYGLIVADNGSNFFASGASYSVDASNGFALTWNDNDIQDSTHGLKSLTYSDFEVVNLTPAVTGLSATSGAAGSTITVTGSNFSGAAGHLQVLFGTTAATNVTVQDDSHVTAVVPAGTGTVDVRVQSGVTVSDTQNINNPVFGYGTSAVTSADRFTYGGTTGNQPPTVAQPASATPSPVTGTTTAPLGTRGRRRGRSGPDLHLAGHHRAVRGEPDLQRQRHERGQELDRDLQPSRCVHVPGHDHRCRRPDGDQQRERDGQPDAHEHHGHAVVGDARLRHQAAVLGPGPGPVRPAPGRPAEFHLVEGQRSRLDQLDRPVHRPVPVGHGRHPGRGGR